MYSYVFNKRMFFKENERLNVLNAGAHVTELNGKFKIEERDTKKSHLVESFSFFRNEPETVINSIDGFDEDEIVVDSPEIGQIAFYKNGEFHYVNYDEISSDCGTPVGIVVIPAKYTSHRKNVCMSLVNMDAKNPAIGNADVPLFDETTSVDTDTYTFTDASGAQRTITGIYRLRHTMSNAHVFDTYYSKYPVDNGEALDWTTIKGYVSQAYYNPTTLWNNDAYYTTGKRDSYYDAHYWYESCDGVSKMKIPCPILSNGKYNKLWRLAQTVTCDMNGKENTQKLVQSALNGVTDVNGELIKWDGTAQALWKEYQVSTQVSTSTSTQPKTQTYTLADKSKIHYYLPNNKSLGVFWNYGALTCSLFEPENTGTHAGDWYLPSSGEMLFASAFTYEINLALYALQNANYNVVPLSHPDTVTYENGAAKEVYTYQNTSSNQNGAQCYITSTPYDNTYMICVYNCHGSLEKKNGTQASRTRAFIQIY